MIDPDSWRTTAAGSKVTSGASIDRKTKSNSTMMNRIDRPWVRLPVVLDSFCWATLVATAPARWKWRPGGAPTFEKAAVMALTTPPKGPG